MFGEEINKIQLSQVAREFKALLSKYSNAYPDARNVLKRASLLIDKAINGEIDSPYRKGFFPEEFWQDGSLFGLNDLSETCAKFNLLLVGAISLEELEEGVHSIEKQAEIDEKELRDKNA